MEIIRGKQSLFVDAATLAERLAGYGQLVLDIGTGDGRYVHHTATANPAWFVIGVDACRENLDKFSRRAPANALYVIAEAGALPALFTRRATGMTINFPWGSLLHGLLADDGELAAKLAALAAPGSRLAVRLNGGALAAAGYTLDEGSRQVRCNLRQAGFELGTTQKLCATDLRCLPTTWAKRLAFGRDPRAVLLSGNA